MTLFAFSSKNPFRAVTLAGLLVLSGLPFLSEPVSADQWTKVDLDNPGSSGSLGGLAVGDGDRDNVTEVYVASYSNGHLYQYRCTNGTWEYSDMGGMGSTPYQGAMGVVVGDGDDDGKQEVYAFGTVWSDPAWLNNVYQYVKVGKNWTVTDIGPYGYHANELSIGDGNDDGRQEIYSADTDGGIYQISLGNEWTTRYVGCAPMQYFPQGNYSQLPIMNGVVVGDGDNDGNEEVYAAASDNHIYRFNYTGSEWNRVDMGGFERSNPQWVSMKAITLGDADNDGRNEVYGLSYYNSTVWQYRWNASSELWEVTDLVDLSVEYAASMARLCIGYNGFEGRNDLYAGTYNKQVYKITRDNDTDRWGFSSIGSATSYVTGIGTGALSGDPDVFEVFAASGDGYLYEFHQDRVPPRNPVVWSDTHPVPGKWYNGTRVHVLWKDGAFDISGIDGYSVAWDNASATVPDDVKDCEQAVHDLGTNLSDGASWYFHIRARDNALNWNLSSAHFGPIRIDTLPPDYASLAINGGAKFTNSKYVNLSVTATDPSPGSGIASMAFSNDGVSWSGWENFSADRPGWDLNDPRFGGRDTDGLKFVHAKVRDTAGNELPSDRRVNASILLDRGAPGDLSIIVNGGAEFTTDENVSLALGSSDAASGVAMMGLSNDGSNWTGWSDWQNSTGWSLTKGAGGSDADGNKTVYLRAADRSGNVGGPVSATIFLDRKAPQNLSVTINDGAVYTNSSIVKLLLSADDPEPASGLSELALANDPQNLTGWEDFTLSKDGWSLTEGAGGTDTDGIKSVQLAVRDRAGNAGGPANSTIFLDRARPGGLSILIDGGAEYAIRPAVNLTLAALDPEPSSGLEMMQFSTDGASWSDWEPFAPYRDFTLSGPDGTRTVHFRVRDRAGNIGDAASATIILDTAPPVITGVKVMGITDRSAIITWTTSEESDSGVDYGLDLGFGTSRRDGGFSVAHSMALDGLTADTTYHFRVNSKDRAGNPPAYSAAYVFITAATPDTTAPAITDVRVSGITDRLAVVSWTTNEPSDSTVEYGRDPGLGQNTSDARNFVLRHSLVLRGLSQATSYYFRVASTDPSGNGPSRSATLSFTTLSAPDVLPPVISNIRVSGITDRLAIVAWETDEPSDGTVRFGLDASYGRTAAHDGLATLHELTLPGLGAGTTYHFRVLCRDATGNGPSASEDLTFTTSTTPDTVPPTIANLEVVGISATGAFVTWETDEPADATVEYGLSTGYGLTATVLEYSLLHTLPLVGLSPDTTYHLRASSSDPSGNAASGPDIVFKTAKGSATPDTRAPAMSDVEVVGVTDTRAVVIWTTDEPADGEVQYGRTTGYGQRASEPAYLFVHSIVLEGLTPSTSYHARARSRDVAGNGPSVGQDIVFVTLSGPDLTPPQITSIRVSNLTATGAVISWDTDEPANGILEYGVTGRYDHSRTLRPFTLRHSVVLTALVPGTTYHFRVGSADPSSNAASPSQDRTFTTLVNDEGPGPRPVPARSSESPWLWALIALALVALLAGMLVLRRSMVKRDTPPGPEETVEMDEDVPYAPAKAVEAAPAAPAAASGARVMDRATMAGNPPPAKRLRCPSCKATIALSRDGPQEITCPACGITGSYRGSGR